MKRFNVTIYKDSEIVGSYEHAEDYVIGENILIVYTKGDERERRDVWATGSWTSAEIEPVKLKRWKR